MIDTDQLVDLAFDAYQDGRVGEAEQLCRQVLCRQPEDALVLHLLGVIAERTGRTALGIDLLRKVIELEPGSVEVLSDLGQLLTQARSPWEAISLFGASGAEL